MGEYAEVSLPQMERARIQYKVLGVNPVKFVLKPVKGGLVVHVCPMSEEYMTWKVRAI
jgi:hypothetical protein